MRQRCSGSCWSGRVNSRATAAHRPTISVPPLRGKLVTEIDVARHVRLNDLYRPVMHVFRKQGGKIRHFWGTELQGNHVDTVWPYWNLMDFTPEKAGPTLQPLDELWTGNGAIRVPRLLAQQPCHPLGHEPLLPAPDRRLGNASLPGDRHRADPSPLKRIIRARQTGFCGLPGAATIVSRRARSPALTSISTSDLILRSLRKSQPKELVR